MKRNIVIYNVREGLAPIGNIEAEYLELYGKASERAIIVGFNMTLSPKN